MMTMVEVVEKRILDESLDVQIEKVVLEIAGGVDGTCQGGECSNITSRMCDSNIQAAEPLFRLALMAGCDTVSLFSWSSRPVRQYWL